jgi:uncharacterized membrane protein YidH (DUF202 family)
LNDDPSTQISDANTRLAQHRTVLALERTLLAWVRTAFASITAAIAINRVLASPSATTFRWDSLWQSSAHIGSLLLSISTTLLLILATWQYIKQSHRIGRETQSCSEISWPAVFASLLVILIGCVGSVLMIIT